MKTIQNCIQLYSVGHKATQQFRFGSAGFNMSIENCLYLRTDFGLQR